MRLAVKYEGSLSKDLDKEIIQVFKILGFRFVGRSYNYKDKIRKIFFEKEEEMEVKFTPGKVTVSENDITIQQFTFEPKCENKQGADIDIIELQKVAIKWAMKKLAEKLEDFAVKSQSRSVAHEKNASHHIFETQRGFASQDNHEVHGKSASQDLEEAHMTNASHYTDETQSSYAS